MDVAVLRDELLFTEHILFILTDFPLLTEFLKYLVTGGNKTVWFVCITVFFFFF